MDTNILVYTVAKADPKRDRAKSILNRGGFVSPQVLNELASVDRRKLLLPWDEIADVLSVVRQFCPTCLPLTDETNLGAIRYAARYQLAFYEALIVASALEAGCDTLLTEDLHHGQLIEGRLTVRNPFLN